MILAKNNYYPTFNSLFDDFFGSETYNKSAYKPNRTSPLVNIKNEESAYVIEVAAPGFSKEQIDIKVENQVLTISSIKSEEKNEENKTAYSRVEFNYEAFERSFTLPKGLVDEDKIVANYENGILYVTVPKSEAAKPKPVRQISIN